MDAKVRIVGGYRGGIYLWLPSWDLLAGTEITVGAEIMTVKLIET